MRKCGCAQVEVVITATFPRSFALNFFFLSTRPTAPTGTILRTTLSLDKWLWETTVPQSSCPQILSSQNSSAPSVPYENLPPTIMTLHAFLINSMHLKAARLLEKDGIVKRCSSSQSFQSTSISESSRPALPRVSPIKI